MILLALPPRLKPSEYCNPCARDVNSEWPLLIQKLFLRKRTHSEAPRSKGRDFPTRYFPFIVCPFLPAGG
jgi:hypothetical protein